MYFIAGSYVHPAGEVDMTNIHYQKMYSERNRIMFVRATLNLQGHLIVSGQAETKAAILALEDAYAKDFVTSSQGNVGLMHDDGTRSAHFLQQSTSINGIRVLSISYGREDGGEYATGRKYAIVLQAEYPGEWEDTIVSFSETVTRLGDLTTQWAYVNTFVQAPILQQMSLITPQRIIQQGHAVGLQGYPLPAPYFNGLLIHGNETMVSYRSPSMHGRNQNLMYTTSWRYGYSTILPSLVFPHEDYPHLY